MEIVKQQYSKKQNAVPIDRLSDLPDSILSHILSFLPATSKSVATSILSRRWRYLWSYVPNLFFYYENSDTINRVLLLRKLHSINTFSLFDCTKRNYHQIHTWITFAVERNVQNIEIYLTVHLDSPRCLFTCKTLIDLTLHRCGVVPDRGSIVFLPHLKRLRLIHVKYEGDDSLSHLISGCPVLEDLVLRLCIDYCSCKISSPTIKSLDVSCHFDKESENQNYNKVEINTPALVYLELLDYANQHIKCGALTSLIEADIEIDCSSINPDDSFLYSRSLVGFFDGLCNVRFLKLDLSQCTKIIDSVFTAWTATTFRNLTKLELISDCCFLSKFLDNADNLEILILQKVYEEVKGWVEPQRVPACLLSRLRTIKLVGIEAIKQDFEMIRYLLRNGQFLERMEIVYPNCYSPVEKMFTMYKLKPILLFERGSTACVVTFAST
ncbi:hypothetical protein ABFS82_13G051300 [Erythranthe guttata]|uniref:F-box protein At4g22280-like n=1 Tax=Erythranthe guttata TaxID=4155 RepID=UPI00064DC987|nr:PREDICTED: F-box protein At4g22280-like [Erythranthe guttata]|eukprot:XP_012832884.1 PREDICTED: F-box protein At4g22280-like [Erythranthe guttata]